MRHGLCTDNEDERGSRGEVTRQDGCGNKSVARLQVYMYIGICTSTGLLIAVVDAKLEYRVRVILAFWLTGRS